MRISDRKHETVVTYYRTLRLTGSQSFCGYMFECDEHGAMDADRAARCAEILAEGEHTDEGIRKFEHTYAIPAVAKCDRCGAHVDLYGFTNTCHGCGADYNMSGDMLADRSQWGEETGESLDDILQA